MKKRTSSITAILLALFSVTLLAQAPGPAPLGKADAVVYKLTFTKFELQDDAGTWHVVNDVDATVDIASATAGTVAKSIVGAAASLPAGHYKAFRSEVSGTMTIQGYWVDTANTKVYYTTSGTKDILDPTGGGVHGKGIIPGVYNGTEAAFITAAGADGTGVTPNYKEGTIRPPTVPTTFYGGEGTEDITVGAGADTPVTEVLEVSVKNTIQVWDFEGAAGPDGVGDVIFPGQPSIILN